mmetsp:Transcript_22524/g.34038  ORF Transcript_22524/g.34038 Transcript_22524/m.34038 type:complete len:292 (+) Transcript_22524:64-939(+)
MKYSLLFSIHLVWSSAHFASSFCVQGGVTTIPTKYRLSTTTNLNLFGGGGSAKIPSSASDRDSIAFNAIKNAINKPKTQGFGLVECEFPPLAALNKLGDGSLRSANEVDTANLKFSQSLISFISLPFIGPKVWLLTSTAASSGFQKAAKSSKSYTFHSLRDGKPAVASADVCILVGPSARNDYLLAQELTTECKAVVLVNGYAKDQKSVPARATMAYYLKPLTYNSQVVGYLTRAYPGAWTTIDAVTNKILKSVDDSQILVKGTNTPDLRESGRLVQKSVDERAIQARQQR